MPKELATFIVYILGSLRYPKNLTPP